MPYLSTHQTEERPSSRQRILTAFLDKYANPDEMEIEVDLPEWDDERVAAMTALYEDDLYLIEGMEGVTLIS